MGWNKRPCEHSFCRCDEERLRGEAEANSHVTKEGIASGYRLRNDGSVAGIASIFSPIVTNISQ